MAPPSPPLPTTMAADLPHQAPAASGTAVRSLPFEFPWTDRTDVILNMAAEMLISFDRWELLPSNTTEYSNLTEQLLTSCDRIYLEVIGLEREILIASRNPPYLHEVDELEIRMRLDCIASASYQVGTVRSCVEKRMNKTAMERSNQPDNHPCLVLDEKATNNAMKIVSVAALTMIAALSNYSAETVAHLARRRLTKEVLFMSPYVCVTVALVGVAFSFCASASNGLGECASIAVLIVCISGIGLGATAAVIILHATRRAAVLWSYVLFIALICAWGWLFAYPKCLKLHIAMLYCHDRRKITNPRRAAYSGTAQHTHKNVLSNFVAACQRAFLPLDEVRTIDILSTMSPSALTVVSAISLWAAHTVAPQAYDFGRLQMFLYIVPYFYLPLAVASTAVIVSASRSNGLASYASFLGLGLCICGIALGACCTMVLLHIRPLVAALLADVLIVTLIVAWGWMFAYPKILNSAVRNTICVCCMRRLRVVPSGRFDGSGCYSWAWLFGLLKIIGRNIVLLPSNCFDRCLRSARHTQLVGVGLDLEVGGAEFEMIRMAAVAQAPEDE